MPFRIKDSNTEKDIAEAEMILDHRTVINCLEFTSSTHFKKGLVILLKVESTQKLMLDLNLNTFKL